MAKLTTDQLKSKKKHHEKRAKFYPKKIKESKKEDNKIGFRIP